MYCICVYSSIAKLFTLQLIKENDLNMIMTMKAEKSFIIDL